MNLTLADRESEMVFEEEIAIFPQSIEFSSHHKEKYLIYPDGYISYIIEMASSTYPIFLLFLNDVPTPNAPLAPGKAAHFYISYRKFSPTLANPSSILLLFK